jgi:DNA-binding transcriptional ArsR family regulator
MALTIDQQLLREALEACDTECITIETMLELRGLCAQILGRRDHPLVGLTLGEDGTRPVLAGRDVRALVGSGVPIYLIRSDELLHGMRELLGGRLAVDRGAVRIWWPGANMGCDPGDHPTVLALEGEPPRVTLEELAQRFELTRPRVRGHIRLIEDARAFLEHELTRAQQESRRVHEHLRDTQIECHTLRTRAEAAEARLAAVEHPSDLEHS